MQALCEVKRLNMYCDRKDLRSSIRTLSEFPPLYWECDLPLGGWPELRALRALDSISPCKLRKLEGSKSNIKDTVTYSLQWLMHATESLRHVWIES
jgi:hypothetical protein